MNTESLEIYLLIMKALENQHNDIALKLKDEIEKAYRGERLDYLGRKHPRDLSNLLARYPNLNLGTLFKNSKSLIHSTGIAAIRNKNINVLTHLQARKYRGPVPVTRTIPSELHTRIDFQKKVMGHLSSAYCVCFDQTGQYIFTGADDNLIKIWHAKDARLLKTLRGHEGQISDMSVNYENKLLASAGMDKIIRIWDLKTSKLLECLTAHNATVTSVKFAPYNRHKNDRYLISTSNDGSVVFWVYDVDKFQFKKLKKFKERNRPGGQITCSSFSTGGSFLACGSSDHCIHVYGFHPDIGPYWLAELSDHKDKVDSVQFCNRGIRFVSGSKDGTAIIWSFLNNHWVPMKLEMDTQPVETTRRSKDITKPMVLIVQWSRDDHYVITSVVDYSIKVWNSYSGQLIHILKKHTHDIYLLESHPVDPRIFISASHDGTLVIWNVRNGKCIKKIWNLVDPKGPCDMRNSAAIYDIKFSPDGNMIAASDAHGFLSIYGNGSAELYKAVPEEMFFHTDYRPLIRDVRHFVMDESTHVAPHLMPRPILVDMNGNPYPSRFQRLVPYDMIDGERVVIPPLAPMQLKTLALVIENHSKQEDEDYIAQKRDFSDYISDSDTIIDSDATEIDEEYAQILPQPSFQHNLRSRGYGLSRDRSDNRRVRRCSARLRCRKRARQSYS